MGWFWGSSADGSSNDPYKNLDPSLRDYLQKESPLNVDEFRRKAQQTGPTPPAENTRTSYSERLGLNHDSISVPAQTTNPSTAAPVVPPESLFQDGRYAHLWKTYRHQSEVEDFGKTDADRLSDIVSVYKERKAEIGRAALENCVEMQIAIQDCFKSGAWAKTMTMCREENRAFNRCFEMQSRFLKALGYLSIQRTPQEEERIQMHADKLYHEMLERERKIKEAKDAGKDAPELGPLIRPEAASEALGHDSAYVRARQKALEKGQPLTLSSFSPEKQKEILERLQGKSKDEQELELQLTVAEGRASLEYMEKIEEQMEEERKHRADRVDRGKETFGDAIKRSWGWDKK